MLPIVDAVLRQQANNEHIRQLKMQRRLLRTNSDPLALPDVRFVELFRLNKEAVQHLLHLLRPHLVAPRYRSGISIETKIFAALRFYATGCYQRSVGEDYHLGLSQTAVHRCIHEITNAINTHVADRYIKFPTTRREQNSTKQEFMDKFNFPGVIGAIDCTHIAILKPTINEHNFINRKGFHSLNVQIISNLKILNVKANYGGSTHDSFVWRQSQIKEYLSNLYNNEQGFWLIGDSGYPLEPWLMTPYQNPMQNTPEERFNNRFNSARNCVERCIGLLKMRFRCVLRERTARYSPQFVGTLVNACVALHNICLDYNVPQIDVENIENNPLPHLEINVNNHLLNEGRRIRQQILQRYFR